MVCPENKSYFNFVIVSVSTPYNSTNPDGIVIKSNVLMYVSAYMN